MELKNKNKFTHFSDKELVDKIITEPYDEEAAIFLIYYRYKPLCVTICKQTLSGLDNLDELQSELFMLLKGKQQDWHALRAFQWKSTLGYWLHRITFNLSLELRKQLIENDGRNTSIDNRWQQEGEKPRPIEIPVDEEAQRERYYRMLLLQEAINMLDNPDQKFVVIKRLQGYSSKQVAAMLQEYWEKKQIVRYNKKKEVVIPDSGYIDNLFKRGYDKVKQLFNSLDK